MTSSELTDIRIKVVGVGGGGTNAVNRMQESAIPLVEYITINTDIGGYNKSNAATNLQIGKKVTKGRGAGAEPQIGFESANENRKDIENAIKDCDILFITSGMGGGTGTGAAPIVAEIAKKLGILTIAVVTKPFIFEGKKRTDNALLGISEFQKYTDALVVVPNDNLKKAAENKLTLANAFAFADDILMQTVKNLVEVIRVTAFINCDCADISSVLYKSGYLHTATGYAEGDGRTEKILSQISESVLLGTTVNGAKGVLICITASKNIRLEEIDIIISSVTEKASEDANVIFGVNFDEEMGDGIKVVLVATKKQT